MALGSASSILAGSIDTLRGECLNPENYYKITLYKYSKVAYYIEEEGK